MPNPAGLGGVIGIDNVAPIYNPNGRWQVWNMDEIYLGTTAANKYVPLINDVIFEIVGSKITRYIVMDINPTTMVPVLHQEDRTNDTANLTDDDILLGIGPGIQSDTYRVYVDKSVTPYRMSVDARLKVAGSLTRWCKIFRGSNISNSGLVISRMYDQNGTLLSENIPLELVATELLDNRAIKVVASCFTNSDLLDGELVTAVLYDDAGFVVSKKQLLVENTAFIRTTDANKKYIISISLKSPFISSTNARLLQYPINVPLNGLNLTGVVTYSSGEVIEYPVDGTKFSLFGLEQYVATQVGQRIGLVLKYSLANTEVAYNALIGSDTHISEEYEAVTLNVDGSYNVKLYPYPVWIDAVSGYRLEWWMYNLDRNIKYNVTPYVTINTNISVFNPIGYGLLQRLSVSVNIRDVNGVYKNYIHTQSIDIVLQSPGTSRGTNWTIGFSPDQLPKYGVGTFATLKYLSGSDWVFKVNSGQTDFNSWLTKIYSATQPLYNPQLESAAPDPTHFALIVGAQRVEYPIAMWNSDLAWIGTYTNSVTVYLQFFKRTNVNDLQLSIAGMQLFQVNSDGTIIQP